MTGLVRDGALRWHAVDRQASLDRLAELLPPPPSVPPVDWPAVEAALGTPLPGDYKAFCERWGATGEIETSGPVTVYRQPAEARSFGKVLRQMRDVDGTIDHVALYPEEGGLLCWGGSESEDVLLWRTEGPPDAWEVVVFRYAPARTGLPFAEWLVAALEGRLPAEHAPPELWADRVAEATWSQRTGADG